MQQKLKIPRPVGDEIPSQLMQELLSKTKYRYGSMSPTQSSSPTKSPDRDRDRDTIQKLLSENNRRLSSSNKEALAKSLLQGTYEIIHNTPKKTNVESNGFAVDSSVTKALAHWKRHDHRNKFLELESNSFKLLPITPQTAVTQAKRRLVKLDSTAHGYTWAGKFVSPPKKSSRGSRTSQKKVPDKNFQIISSIAGAQKEIKE